MKTLVIIAHPDITSSKINKQWIEALKKYPEKFTIHQLYLIYPDEKINIVAEQKLVEKYDNIVFQFPFYWFSAPPLLKKWFDEVLTYGWAYGSKSGFKLADKNIGLAITAGIDQEEYTADGLYKYNLKELTVPFELTFNYIKANYKGFYAYYGVELNSTASWIEKSIKPYLEYLEQIPLNR